MAQRTEMIAELKLIVLPYLRSEGFKGSFPHFRRLEANRVDLITFQFDRRGGGLVIELARCPISGTTTPKGEHIPATKVQAWDIHPDFRRRLKSCLGSDTDAWFRFDIEPPAKVARAILAKLGDKSTWGQVELGQATLRKS